MIPAMTREDIATAMQLVGWRPVELAAYAGLSDYAAHSLKNGLTTPRQSTLDKAQRALEARGVEFTDDGPRLRRP